MGVLASREPGARELSRPRGEASVHLDALRAVAAFSVLLNHWRDANFIDYSSLGHHNALLAVGYLLAGLGHQWVIVFFVMSGYLVGGSVLNSFARGKWSWRAYLLARLTRLLIVLLPALILGGIWDWVGMHQHLSDALYSGRAGLHELTADVHATLKPRVFLENTIFLQTLVLPGMGGKPVPAFGSNGPLWSLANEFWYYIAFPIVVMLLSRGMRRRKKVVSAAVLIAWGWFVGGPIVVLGIPWLTGVAITFIPRGEKFQVFVQRIIVLSALVLLAGGLAMAKLFPGTSSDLVLGLIVAFLVWALVNCTSGTLPRAYTRVAQRGAHSSYTLYLVHVPLLIFLAALFHLNRVEPTVPAVFVRLSLIGVIMIYAQLVYMAFERNTDRVRQWLKGYVM